jgi:hypothetical protein
MPIAISTAWLTITPASHTLVARVDQIGKGFSQPPAGKLRQTRIQPLVHRTDRAGREAVAAQFFSDRFHPYGSIPLHVHLRQRR